MKSPAESSAFHYVRIQLEDITRSDSSLDNNLSDLFKLYPGLPGL